MHLIPERRVAARHPTVSNRIVLAWHGRDGGGHSCGRLLDISQSGALISVDGISRSCAGISMRLVTPGETDWVDGQVVAVTRGLLGRILRRGPYLVRIRFLNQCPYEVFKIATHGAIVNAVPRPELLTRLHGSSAEYSQPP